MLHSTTERQIGNLMLYLLWGPLLLLPYEMSLVKSNCTLVEFFAQYSQYNQCMELSSLRRDTFSSISNPNPKSHNLNTDPIYVYTPL